MQNLDYWERRYDEIFPNGLTQGETDEANANMWKGAYPTLEMAREDEEQDCTAAQENGCNRSADSVE